MDENEETSVIVTNDSENSDVGEGLINCYGSPVGRIVGSHRNTALPRQNFSRFIGEFHRFWHHFGYVINIAFLIILNRLTSAKTIVAQKKWGISWMCLS